WCRPSAARTSRPSPPEARAGRMTIAGGRTIEQETGSAQARTNPLASSVPRR
ncbi:MAG: hypothetical protein AVDCRST_MAG59-4178, partial [uncultured Thermomicrobiales bacterium]